MFSEHMGTIVHREDEQMLMVRAGEAGHAVYGPYENIGPGRFRVDFAVACADHGVDASTHSATLDIAANRGVVVLARRELKGDDLGVEPRTFSLELDNREFRALEYRVYATGAAGLLVGEPRLTRLGELLLPAEIDPTIASSDPVVLQHQVRAVLRLLRPHRPAGFRKVRLGRDGTVAM